MAQPRHGAISGIQVWTYHGFVRERIVCAVVVAHAVPKFAIQLRGAVCLDPLMLIRWNALLCELSTNPIGFLHEDDGEAVSQSCYRRGAAPNR